MNDKTAQNAAERIAELEAELARVKAENRHIRETHYHESTFKAFASRKAQGNATAFDAITKDKQTLAGFLRSLPCIEAPWDTAFQKHYCSSCIKTDEHGFPVDRIETATTVFADKKSVGFSEFYKAQQAGYTTELKFDVHFFEYQRKDDL